MPLTLAASVEAVLLMRRDARTPRLRVVSATTSSMTEQWGWFELTTVVFGICDGLSTKLYLSKSEEPVNIHRRTSEDEAWNHIIYCCPKSFEVRVL